MGKATFKTISIATFIIVLAGCKSNSGHQYSDTDLAKISAWNKFFGKSLNLSSALRPNDQPVCHTYADPCTAMYQHVYKNAANVDSISKAYTSSEDFGSQNLSSWALDIANNTDAAQIKVCFGIYTPQYAAKFPSAKPGRLAVFLYPVNSSKGPAKYNKPSTYTPPAPNGCATTATAPAVGTQADPFNLAGVEP